MWSSSRHRMVSTLSQGGNKGMATSWDKMRFWGLTFFTFEQHPAAYCKFGWYVSTDFGSGVRWILIVSSQLPYGRLLASMFNAYNIIQVPCPLSNSMLSFIILQIIAVSKIVWECLGRVWNASRARGVAPCPIHFRFDERQSLPETSYTTSFVDLSGVFLPY